MTNTLLKKAMGLILKTHDHREGKGLLFIYIIIWHYEEKKKTWDPQQNVNILLEASTNYIYIFFNLSRNLYFQFSAYSLVFSLIIYHVHHCSSTSHFPDCTCKHSLEKKHKDANISLTKPLKSYWKPHVEIYVPQYQ